MTRASVLIFTSLFLAACAASNPQWQQTELFFGMSKPAGGNVSDEEWKDFLDRSVTPKFPDGFTVVEGAGQYREENGHIDHERNKVLIVLHSQKTLAEDNAKLDAVAREYDARFGQESVLRTDRAVDAAFVAAPAGGK